MVKDSEYRRQFRSRWDKHAPVYDDNVEYRFVRRSVEHNHHSDAFVWDERDWWESDSVFSAGARPLSGVPLHKYKHKKFNQAYQDRLIQYEQEKKRQRRGVIKQSTSSDPSTPEHEKQSRVKHAAKQQAIEQYSPVSVSIEKPESRNAMVQVNGSATPSTSSVEGPCPVHGTPVVNHGTQTNCRKVQQILNGNDKKADKGLVSPHDEMEGRMATTKPAYRMVSRPKKPVNKPIFSVLGPKQARPRSAPPSKAAKILSEKPKQPPFLAFGYKDREREIGAKKTHNVKASAEVYPSALRAQKRMELVMKQIEEEAKNASNFEKRRRALFNDRPKAESWDTEYRRNYVGYNGQEYEKVLSARLHPLKHPSAYFIPA